MELFWYETKFFFANYLLSIFSFVNSIQKGILNKNYIMFNMISYILLINRTTEKDAQT